VELRSTRCPRSRRFDRRAALVSRDVRVVISADMEGISQLVDPDEILAFTRAYWATGRRRLTADVVAAADGLLAAGADEVIVLDNHASGNPENVPSDALPDGARLETWNVFDLRSHGVDALLQVGYHARAGVSAFVSHTYVPGLWLRADGELISESHGRAWAAGVPLLGIVGNDAHERTLGSLAGVPYLAVQRTSSATHVTPVFDVEGAAEAITAFAANSLRQGGGIPSAPSDLLFEASLRAGDEETRTLAAAGWRQESETEYAIDLASWDDAREPLAAAMGAAIARWLPHFTAFDLTSEAAAEAVRDEPMLLEARAGLDAWLDEPQPEWLTPVLA
jgi:D-aminopeptidase